MAAIVSSTMGNKSHSTDNYDVFADAWETQRKLVSSFDEWLVQRASKDGDRSGVISRVQRRLKDYEQWLQDAGMAKSAPDAIEPWSMEIRTLRSDAGFDIVVTGPRMNDKVVIAAKDEKEVEYLTSDEYLGYMVKICHAFEQAQRSLILLFKVAQQTNSESLKLSQPAEGTIQTHIRLLQEYNDVKDIGQQLIGLIAENQGVPIRTLYEGGQYGVTADD